MATEKTVFAVSDIESENARLASPDAIARLGSLASALAHNIYPFAHSYDPVSARAWLREAARLSAADIDAMSPAQQEAAVLGIENAFGNFWRFMNISPYGWKKLRDVVEEAWDPHTHEPVDKTNPYWNGRSMLVNENGTYAYPGQWGGSWRYTALSIWNRFRQVMGTSIHPYIGGLPTEIAGTRDYSVGAVMFGMRSSYNDAPGGIGCASTSPSCYAPTGESHRLWITAKGVLAGNRLNPSTTTYVATVDETGHPAPRNWRTLQFESTESNVFVEMKRLWVNPPLKWYFDLLRSPTVHATLPEGSVQRPAVVGGGVATIVGARAEIAGVPRGHVPVSLIEYLLSKTGPEIAREVALDVVQRNSAMSAVWNLSEARLVSFGTAESLRRGEEAAADQTAAIINRVGFSLAATIAAANPLAGVVAGAAVLIGVLALSLKDSDLPENIDVYGRLMPTYEMFGITESDSQYRALTSGIGLPAGTRAPVVLGDMFGRDVINVGADQSAFAHANTSQTTLSVVVDGVPGATVKVDGAGENNDFWPAPWGPRSVPAGTYRIVIRAPGRVDTPRMAILDIGANATVSLTSADMPIATEQSLVTVPSTTTTSNMWPIVAVGGVAAVALGGWWMWKQQQSERAKPKRNPRRRTRQR